MVVAMSVNGTAKDRRTGKPLNDSTSWSVKSPDGTILSEPHPRGKKGEDKPLTNLNAADAFSAVRALRIQGITAAAIRS